MLLGSWKLLYCSLVTQRNLRSLFSTHSITLLNRLQKSARGFFFLLGQNTDSWTAVWVESFYRAAINDAEQSVCIRTSKVILFYWSFYKLHQCLSRRLHVFTYFQLTVSRSLCMCSSSGACSELGVSPWVQWQSLTKENSSLRFHNVCDRSIYVLNLLLDGNIWDWKTTRWGLIKVCMYLQKGNKEYEQINAQGDIWAHIFWIQSCLNNLANKMLLSLV